MRFSYFAKYYHWAEGNWSEPARGWDCLWDDQMGTSQEIWNSTRHACYHVWDSDGSCFDYRYGNLGGLDWCRGLGSFILLGIDRNNASLILIGALSSAVLAIAFNFLLKVMEKAKLRTIFSGFALVALLLGLSYSPALWFKKRRKTWLLLGK